MRRFALGLAGVLSVACSGSSAEPIAASDATTDSGGCGVAPTPDCFTGAVGRACSDVGQAFECTETGWTCPTGTVRRSQCGCAAGPVGPGVPPRLPGEACGSADAGPDGATDAGGDAGCDCLDKTLKFAWNGGLGAYTDQSSVAPCRTYGHERLFAGGGAPRTCSVELLPCGADAIDIGDLQLALANADAVAAFAAAPVLYGTDPRPVDGQVFQIVLGSKAIEVGGDCGATAGCKPIPPGVKALAKLLQALDANMLAASPCKEAIKP